MTFLPRAPGLSAAASQSPVLRYTAACNSRHSRTVSNPSPLSVYIFLILWLSASVATSAYSAATHIPPPQATAGAAGAAIFQKAASHVFPHRADARIHHLTVRVLAPSSRLLRQDCRRSDCSVLSPPVVRTPPSPGVGRPLAPCASLCIPFTVFTLTDS